MINLDQVLSNVISVLNTANPTMTFIRNYNIHNAPAYPYGTVGVLTGYIPENENNRPAMIREYDPIFDNLKVSRIEHAQTSLSFNVFSDSEEQAYEIAMQTIACLRFLNYEDLKERGIIVLNTSNPNNQSGILEVGYEYRFQFDVTIRVLSTLEKHVDFATSVEINQN